MPPGARRRSQLPDRAVFHGRRAVARRPARRSHRGAGTGRPRLCPRARSTSGSSDGHLRGEAATRRRARSSTSSKRERRPNMSARSSAPSSTRALATPIVRLSCSTRASPCATAGSASRAWHSSRTCVAILGSRSSSSGSVSRIAIARSEAPEGSRQGTAPGTGHRAPGSARGTRPKHPVLLG